MIRITQQMSIKVTEKHQVHYVKKKKKCIPFIHTHTHTHIAENHSWPQKSASANSRELSQNKTSPSALSVSLCSRPRWLHTVLAVLPSSLIRWSWFCTFQSAKLNQSFEKALLPSIGSQPLSASTSGNCSICLYFHLDLFSVLNSYILNTRNLKKDDWPGMIYHLFNSIRKDIMSVNLYHRPVTWTPVFPASPSVNKLSTRVWTHTRAHLVWTTPKKNNYLKQLRSKQNAVVIYCEDKIIYQI